MEYLIVAVLATVATWFFKFRDTTKTFIADSRDYRRSNDQEESEED